VSLEDKIGICYACVLSVDNYVEIESVSIVSVCCEAMESYISTL